MFEPTKMRVSGWMHRESALIARVLAAKKMRQEHEHCYGQADAREPTTTTTTTTTTTKGGSPWARFQSEREEIISERKTSEKSPWQPGRKKELKEP